MALKQNFSVTVAAKSRYFVEYRDALAHALAGLGCSAAAVEEPAPGPDAVVVVGAHLYSSRRLRGHGKTIYAAVQTEQLPTREAGAMAFGKQRFKVFARFYKDYDLIFDWHPATHRALAATRPNIVHVPYGWFPAIRFLEEEAARPGPEYDILFLGDPVGVDGRRKKLLERLEKRFTVYPEYSGLWKHKKAAPILSCRLGLNIHYDHAYTFESPRFFEYLCNGLPMLSEPVTDSWPFRPGADYAEARYEDMEAAAARLLNAPDELLRLGEQGRRTALAYPIERTAELMLRRILLEREFRRDSAYRRRNRLFHATGWPRLLQLP